MLWFCSRSLFDGHFWCFDFWCHVPCVVPLRCASVLTNDILIFFFKIVWQNWWNLVCTMPQRRPFRFVQRVIFSLALHIFYIFQFEVFGIHRTINATSLRLYINIGNTKYRTTVKHVYSGQLLDKAKVTTIDGWPLWTGFLLLGFISRCMKYKYIYFICMLEAFIKYNECNTVRKSL